MTDNSCDVLIIGAGPAGLSSAWELSQRENIRIAIIEKGPSWNSRFCRRKTNGECMHCRICSVLSGIGGPSGFSGGKFCLFPAGKRLLIHTGYSVTEANHLVSDFLGQLDEPLRNLVFNNIPQEFHLQEKSGLGNVFLKKYSSVPLLEHTMKQLFSRIMDDLNRQGVAIRTGTEVIDIEQGVGNYRFKVICNHNGERYGVSVRDAVVIATGRTGVDWTECLLSAMGIPKKTTTVDIGVRLQLPASEFINFLPSIEDPKLTMHQNTPLETRTLCWCRKGALNFSQLRKTILVDGHFGSDYSDCTSISLVARIPVPKGESPLNFAFDRLGYFVGKHKSSWQSLYNFLGILKTNTDNSKMLLSIPGEETNIRKILHPEVRERIIELFESIHQLSEGINIKKGIVYAPVIDNFWQEPLIDDSLMTNVPGLFLSGDATGLARGIAQGFFSGLVVSRKIAEYLSIPAEREEQNILVFS